MATAQGFHIYTFGCQMNERDSQIMSALLTASGMAPAVVPDESSLIILNTCHIREHAEQRALSLLGRLKSWRSRGPGRILILAGCVAEALKENVFMKFPHLDVVIGPSELLRLPDLVRAARTGSGGRLIAVGHGEAKSVPELDAESAGGHKAGIKVMEGCGHRCTFCVVPAVRGPARSRPLDSIAIQAERLAEKGTKEIILLGQAVNAYRETGTDGADFSALLKRLDRIDGLSRIRFISSHPAHMSTEAFETMAGCNKVCKHVHLPVQSGSDSVLKRMQRGYTAGAYLDLLKRARKILPEISFTTDVIVGFPGENERDFESTIELVKASGFDAAFAFKYSARPGTPAGEMPDQLPESVKEERLARINSLLDTASRERNDSQVGLDGEILVESISGCGRKCAGRLMNNKLVHVEGDMSDAKPGDLLRVRIIGAGGYSLRGRLTAKDRA